MRLAQGLSAMGYHLNFFAATLNQTLNSMSTYYPNKVKWQLPLVLPYANVKTAHECQHQVV